MSTKLYLASTWYIDGKDNFCYNLWFSDTRLERVKDQCLKHGKWTPMEFHVDCVRSEIKPMIKYLTHLFGKPKPNWDLCASNVSKRTEYTEAPEMSKLRTGISKKVKEPDFYKKFKEYIADEDEKEIFSTVYPSEFIEDVSIYRKTKTPPNDPDQFITGNVFNDEFTELQSSI